MRNSWIFILFLIIFIVFSPLILACRPVKTERIEDKTYQVTPIFYWKDAIFTVSRIDMPEPYFWRTTCRFVLKNDNGMTFWCVIDDNFYWIWLKVGDKIICDGESYCLLRNKGTIEDSFDGLLVIQKIWNVRRYKEIGKHKDKGRK